MKVGFRLLCALAASVTWGGYSVISVVGACYAMLRRPRLGIPA